MVKSIGKYLLGFVLGFAVLIAGLVVFVVWPMNKRLEAAKPKLQSVAQAFAQCRESKDTNSDCLKLTTESFQKTTSAENWEAFTGKMQTALGKRMSAEIVPESLNITTFQSFTGRGTKDRIVVHFKSIYEKDPFVTEKFVMIHDPETDIFLVEGYNIGSTLMIR
ncbi:hypothetical protein [Bdellovibrio sp. HCB209]|uniref:hypothetical protein n=1 Tax=Bdellovibrio sp. HCB209 TaxID=3394354 RepID=UPI0039B3B3DD